MMITFPSKLTTYEFLSKAGIQNNIDFTDLSLIKVPILVGYRDDKLEIIKRW